jgi:hypothetical protein
VSGHKQARVQRTLILGTPAPCPCCERNRQLTSVKDLTVPCRQKVSCRQQQVVMTSICNLGHNKYQRTMTSKCNLGHSKYQLVAILRYCLSCSCRDIRKRQFCSQAVQNYRFGTHQVKRRHQRSIQYIQQCKWNLINVEGGGCSD